MIPFHALCTSESLPRCCACNFMWDEPLQSYPRIDGKEKGLGPYCRLLQDVEQCPGPRERK